MLAMHVKYLGVELDQCLSLTQERVAEPIISKSNGKLKFLRILMYFCMHT